MLRLVMLGLVVATAAVVALAFVARHSDGPIGPFPGGPLQGEMWQGPEPEWSFASGLDTIEVQVNPGHPRSGLTGVIIHDGKLYVPTTLEPIKRWHKYVLEDSRVILRIDGRLYRRCATRVTDPKLLEVLIGAGQAKYGRPYHTSWAAPFTWYWRMDPPDDCFASGYGTDTRGRVRELANMAMEPTGLSFTAGREPSWAGGSSPRR